MTLSRRLAHGYKAISSALTHAATRWSRCPHCDAHTPWVAHAWRGYYRCLECGQNPLDHQHAGE